MGLASPKESGIGLEHIIRSKSPALYLITVTGLLLEAKVLSSLSRIVKPREVLLSLGTNEIFNVIMNLACGGFFDL